MGISVIVEHAFLRFSDSSKPVLDISSFKLLENCWTCLLGPNGCGKSSLLRLIAGLIEPQHEIHLKVKTSDCQPLQGRIAYMAQHDFLLPWLTALKNVYLEEHVKERRIKPHTQKRALSLLKQLGLSNIAGQLPETLSGGQRQRVALARILMMDRPIILMDEPFSALDTVNRLYLQTLSANRLKNHTVLLVTHDPQEAVRLGESLYLLDDGEIEQLSCPQTPIPRPVDAKLGEYQALLLNKLGISV